MSRIVLVHGAFNELWGPHELAARWTPALRDGLWHQGTSIADDDVAVCFYGDLFRRQAEGDDVEAFAAARAGVADSITKLSGSGLLDSLTQAAGDAVLDRTIDMATTMATTPDLTDQVMARLEAVVTADTRVVVGHSLGSVIAYRGLCLRPAWTVDTLVTLGSPLGSPFVLDWLGRAQGGDSQPWPGSVSRWVNVAALSDHIVTVKALADAYGDRVEDHLVDNGARGHDPEPYLNAVVTGAAIARALAS